MQAKSILLTTLNAKYIHLNLAIRLLYELNKNDERLCWKEFTIKEDIDTIVNCCKEYEIVCFSCYIWNITKTLEVCKLLKTENAAIKILLGGPEVTYDWQALIKNDFIDFIITGEGEIPFEHFLKRYPDVEHIPNLVSKKDNEVNYYAATENFKLELYQNTNPYQNDDVNTLANRVLYIETSRGCPYKCEFCLASLDNRVRYLPIEHIKSNLLYLMQHGRVIKFLDRTFNVKKDFTLEIFEFILAHRNPANIFQFEITADILHPAIIEFIKEKVPKGIFRFEIGIQTVNQKANLEVSRKQNFEKTKEVIIALKDVVDMHLDLIVGLPLDYWNDIKYSFEEVFKLFAPELQLGFLKFLKGTPVRNKHEQHGYVFGAIAPYQIIKSNYLTEEELLKITKLEHALEIYWNKKRLVHTLKYVTKHYSIFNFLLGVGELFEERIGKEQYNIIDTYSIALEFMKKNFTSDKYLQELLTVDYCLHHKVKPAAKFIKEINRKEKFSLLKFLKFPHQKLRYIALELNFDYQTFIEENIIQRQRQTLIIEYTGTSKPKIVFGN